MFLGYKKFRFLRSQPPIPLDQSYRCHPWTRTVHVVNTEEVQEGVEYSV